MVKSGFIFSVVNWVTNIKNIFFRKIIEVLTRIDQRVRLPKYNSETFSNFFKNNIKKINLGKVYR